MVDHIGLVYNITKTFLFRQQSSIETEPYQLSMKFEFLANLLMPSPAKYISTRDKATGLIYLLLWRKMCLFTNCSHHNICISFLSPLCVGINLH